MGNFKIIKRGYSQLEVDSYIDKIKNDYEAKLSEQKDRIFYLKDELGKITQSSDNELMTSLVSAVERAKIIENSSKNIYELETKKLSLLYTKMENLLKDENIYNDRSIKQELLSLIQDCRNSLQNNIETQRQNIKESTSGDPIKRLLSKMIDFNKVPLADKTKQKTNTGAEGDKTQSIEVIQVKREQKPEVKSEYKKPMIAYSEFEKFLSEDKVQNGTNFENIMFQKADTKPRETQKNHNQYDLAPNESGFDLKEAVNPKDDLEEIMKAFDFYNNNKKDFNDGNKL